MSYLNVEIKARCTNAAFIRNYLLSNNASFKGIDEQTDTYYNVINGRLKMREGNIENNLIYYERSNQAGPKDSNFNLLKVENTPELKNILSKAIGVKIIVKKIREIYYAGNVKFHIDEVPGLGSFVEIEAGNINSDLSQKQLQEQCEFYLKEFDIHEKDLIEVSYSDLLLETQNTIVL